VPITAPGDTTHETKLAAADQVLHNKQEPPAAEPHGGWCGRTAGVIPPPTRSLFHLIPIRANQDCAFPILHACNFSGAVLCSVRALLRCNKQKTLSPSEDDSVIRQAISCDICGAEMQRGNHWFVAQVHGGELRLSGWSANKRLRAGAKHLCGQTCLHKLVDEFLAGTIRTQLQPAACADATPVVLVPQNLPQSRSALAATAREHIESTKQSNSYLDEFESSAPTGPNT